MKKLQLLQDCHKLWNKTGGFGWDYNIQSAPADVAFTALGGNYLAFMENYSNPGSSTGAHNSTLPCYHHHESDPFLSLSTIDNVLPQTGLGYDAAAPSNGDILPAYRPGDIEADQSSSLKAIDMTTCTVCNQYHLTSDMCPYCFGQPPGVVASGEVISQNNLGPALQMSQSQISYSDFTKTESSLIYGTKAWSSDGLGSRGLPMPQSDPPNSQTLSYSLRARTSTASDDLSTIEDNLGLSAPAKATKRKRTTKDTMVPEHGGRKIQDRAKKQKKTPLRHTTESQKGTSRRPPVDTSKLKLTSNDERLLLPFRCVNCHHERCSYCPTERTASGDSIWFCHECGASCSSRSLI